MANQDFRVKNGLQVGVGITTPISVGIGTTEDATSHVDVQGTLETTGTITASSFSGSGSGLTSIPAGQLSGTVPSAALSGTYDISIGSGESVQTNTIGVGTLTATYSVAVGSGDNQIAITSTGTISGPSTFIIDPAPVGIGSTDGDGAVYIKGDLYVQGTQFQVDSTTINLADKVIGVGTTCTSDALLDGAGIGIGSDGNQKTFTFEDTGDNLKSSENLNLASGKSYKINNTSVLSGTTLGSNVVNSSLTSLGTIATGTWQGTAIDDDYIGTINNTNKVSLSALNIDGGTATSTVADSDLMIIDDGANGTNRKVTASTLKSYFVSATYADSAGIATYAGNAGIATNLKGGSAGKIPYQSGADTTSFLTLGTSSQVLIGGSSAPTFTNISGLSVGSATNADNVAVTRLDTAGVGVGTTSSYHLVMTDLGASGSYDNLYANPSNLKFKYRPDTNTLTFSNDGSSVGIITGAYYFGDESQNFIAHSSPAGLTGSNNIIIGTNAGYSLTEGSQNIIIGSGTTVNDNAGDKQLVIGAGRTDRWISGDSNFNIGIGHTYGDTISAKLDVKGGVNVFGNIGIGTTNPRSGLEAHGITGARITRALTGGNVSGYKFQINNPSSNSFSFNCARVINDTVGTNLFDITSNGDIVPSASGQTDLGSETSTWDNIYGGTLYTDDKIAHRNDNTFIRFPDVDTFSVETSGSERFRITSNGNVGIGSTQPTVKLDVDGSVKATSFVGVADSATKVYVDESEDDTQYYNIIFSDENPDVGDKYHTLQVDNNGLSFNPGLNTLYVNGSLSLKDKHTLVPITTSLTSVAGVSTTIDTFATSSNDLAEYTISIGCNFFSSSGISTEGTIGITTDVITGIVTTGITPGLVVQNANVSYGTTVISIGTSEVNLSSTTTNVGIATTVFDFGNIQSHMQAQKVLVMHDGTTAYVQEYAIMSNPSRIVSIDATISGSNVLLQATPETGISGITTYKIVRGGIS